MATPAVYSLYDLHRYLRQVIALNLPDPLWIVAELVEVSTSQGHVFCSLVEVDPDTEAITAQASAICWERDWRRLRRRYGQALEQVVRAGQQLQLFVRTSFHERYGFRLLIEDIDLDFALGQLQREREQAMAQLRAEGLLMRNAVLPLPPLVQRLAVISSATAAGWADFSDQLLGNAAGYHYELTLFSATVQGEVAAAAVRERLAEIMERAADFDVIVVVRGGGARLDLLAFDDLELCRAAAQASLPVLTGIGHETDQVLLDAVAHTALKTPTAVADWLVQHTQRADQLLGSLSHQLYHRASAQLQRAQQRLDYCALRLPLLVEQRLNAAENRLDRAATLLHAWQPEHLLERGYSLLIYQNKVVKNPADIPVGAAFSVRTAGGLLHGTRTQE